MKTNLKSLDTTTLKNFRESLKRQADQASSEGRFELSDRYWNDVRACSEELETRGEW